jgi:outer membrane protein OmpA-like peptidoglycan-associated protein
MVKALLLLPGIFAQLSQHPRVGELAQIDFARNSERLSVDYNKKLGEVAGWAVEHPDGLIVVDGFARPDEKTNAPAAVVLSLRRAEAVRDEIVAQGIDPDRVVVAAFGGRGSARAIVWGTRESRDLTVSRLERSNATAILWGQRGRTAVAGR